MEPIPQTRFGEARGGAGNSPSPTPVIRARPTWPRQQKAGPFSNRSDHPQRRVGARLNLAKADLGECAARLPDLGVRTFAMDQKTFLLVAGLIFGVVALFHLLRIFAEWTLMVGNWSVPKWVSWVAVIVAGGLALIGLRLSQR